MRDADPSLAPTLAVIGGGQLARMMAEPAAAMGLPLRLLAEAEGVSAAQVIPDHLVGDHRDLATLRRAGLVHATVDAQRRVYALDPRPIVELETWLAPYRALWSDALDRLGTHLHDTREDR